jgi:CBS domain-containing protein
MKKARDIMTAGADYIEESATVAEAAKHFASGNFGAIPVCNRDGRLQGMVTDRDVVVKVVAAGKDPNKTKVKDLTDQPEVVTIGADDSVDEALETMKRAKVRRLPVIDGTALVGMVSQADLARSLPPDKVGDLLAAISS